MHIFNDYTISILIITTVALVAKVESKNNYEELQQQNENALKTRERVDDVLGSFSISTNAGKSREKRQVVYDPYYYPRPYPLIIVGGVGLGGFGFGRGFGRPGFGGRGFGGRGFGGRGIGGPGFGGRGFGGSGFGGRGLAGRGFGGRGIGGRGGFGGFGGRGGRG